MQKDEIDDAQAQIEPFFPVKANGFKTEKKIACQKYTKGQKKAKIDMAHVSNNINGTVLPNRFIHRLKILPINNQRDKGYDGFTTFIVDTDTPGFKVERTLWISVCLS